MPTEGWKGPKADQFYRIVQGDEPMPPEMAISLLTRQYESGQLAGGSVRLTRAEFETSADMYGPPPGWNYQTSERGWKGEPLPPGAYGWTPPGEPYFQNGLITHPPISPTP